MASLPRLWKAAIVLSLAALLSFLARTFLDFRFVYEEIGLDVPSLSVATILNLAFFAGWIWALIVASHAGRKAMYALLALDVLLILFGLSTLTSFCPSPCQTAWPLGEVLIWSNLLIGVPAVATAIMALRTSLN
jgi:hypothetical protein